MNRYYLEILNYYGHQFSTNERTIECDGFEIGRNYYSFFNTREHGKIKIIACYPIFNTIIKNIENI